MVPIEHFCCQNSDCPRAGVRGGENLSFRDYSGKARRIRLVYCRACKRSFSERNGTVREHARLPDEKALAILNHLREGCGTRATSRLVEVDKNTVNRYLALAGSHAESLHDELVAFSLPGPVRSRSTRSGATSIRRRRRATRPTPWIGRVATTGTIRRSTPRAGCPWPWCPANAMARPASG